MIATYHCSNCNKFLQLLLKSPTDRVIGRRPTKCWLIGRSRVEHDISEVIVLPIELLIKKERVEHWYDDGYYTCECCGHINYDDTETIDVEFCKRCGKDVWSDVEKFCNGFGHYETIRQAMDDVIVVDGTAYTIESQD